MKKYQLTLTKEQLNAVKEALELRFRIDLCQDYELSDILARMNMDLDSMNPNHERIFDEYILRKDHIGAIVKALFEIAKPRWALNSRREEEALICEDIWQAIRYQLWKDNPNHTNDSLDSRPPLPVSEQPLPEIVTVNRGKK